MLNRHRFLGAASATLLAGSLCMAAPPATTLIGTASADSFVLDGQTVRGNASLFNGNQVQTTDQPVWMALTNGAHVGLGMKSSGSVSLDRLTLTQGGSQSSGLPIAVNGMTVTPEGDALVRVLTDGQKRVEVTTVSGSARVVNKSGMLIAEVTRGRSIAFTEQDSGAGQPTQITGCIERIRGTDNYVVRDETTSVVYQVTGPDVAANAGKRVQVTGSPDTSATATQGASQVVHETALTPSGGKGCRAEIAAAGDAAGAAAAAAAGGAVGGMSVTTIALIGGIAAAAIVGGLAASGTIFGPSSQVTTQVSP